MAPPNGGDGAQSSPLSVFVKHPKPQLAPEVHATLVQAQYGDPVPNNQRAGAHPPPGAPAAPGWAPATVTPDRAITPAAAPPTPDAPALPGLLGANTTRKPQDYDPANAQTAYGGDYLSTGWLWAARTAGVAVGAPLAAKVHNWGAVLPPWKQPNPASTTAWTQPFDLTNPAKAGVDATKLTNFIGPNGHADRLETVLESQSQHLWGKAAAAGGLPGTQADQLAAIDRTLTGVGEARINPMVVVPDDANLPANIRNGKLFRDFRRAQADLVHERQIAFAAEENARILREEGEFAAERKAAAYNLGGFATSQVINMYVGDAILPRNQISTRTAAIGFASNLVFAIPDVGPLAKMTPLAANGIRTAVATIPNLISRYFDKQVDPQQ